jgi:cell division protein FtsI (penicillin-binding protein 3)|tara:strand:- start:2143 stop:4008 length:1866 start_codon:yes stop_codon:yes gene_type:complete
MVFDSSHYRRIGFKQSKTQEPLIALRGNIYDKNGVSLTKNIIHYSVGAHVEKIKNKEEIAISLSKITGRDSDFYSKKLKNKTSGYQVLELKVGRKVGEKIEKDIPELKTRKQSRRFYPHANIASQIIGFTKHNDSGLVGIERYYEKFLAGKDGWIVKQKNVAGRKGSFHKTSFPIKEPIKGSNVQLTIDIEYQSILQEELQRRIEEAGAKGAMGILMNPQNGDILAMASLPDFDLNNPNGSPLENQKNKIITDQFEPGSTYKIVAATAALESKKINLFDEFNCEEGKVKIDGWTISDHEQFGVLTFPQIIANSSNVGVIKIAQKLGKDPLYNTSRSFGFGAYTGIGFPGESQGILRKKSDWNHMSIASVSIGYEVAVTALQIATAYSAIANGGVLLKPQLVKQIINEDGSVAYRSKPESIRKIAQANIMMDMKHILEKVVDEGTGIKADIEGWTIAGKTGTAIKYLNGSYSNKYISNFAGFFPSENPQVVGVVVLDEPNHGLHWGGYGAAPLFKRIAERIINLDDSFKHYKNEISDSKNLIAVKKVDTLPTLTTKNIYKPYTDGYVIIPDVRGMSIKKAKKLLIKNGLKPKFTGSGKVAWQSPKPGSKELPGSSLTISLKQ